MAKTTGKDLEKKIKQGKGLLSLQSWIEKNNKVIQKALPKGFTPERMMRILVGVLRNNPLLGECTQISFVSAIMQSVQLGLEPNTVLGQAYLIPYWNSKLNCREVQFQLGYKGLLDMAYRTREFKEIYAQEVYSGDFFEFVLGTEKYIRHVPIDNPDLDENNKPIVTHVYAVYKNVKGGEHFVIWTRDKLERHKEKYVQAFKKGGKEDKFSAWTQSTIAMYKKTVLKDLLKYADISVEFRRKIEVDETVKREIKPDMIEVKPVYEYDANDLGKTGEEKLEKKLEEKRGKKKVKRKPKAEPESETKPEIIVTEKQLKRYYALLKEAKLEPEKVDIYIKKKYEVEHKKDLTMDQMNEIFEGLEKKIKENKKKEKAEKDIIKPTKSDLGIMFVKARGAGYSREDFKKYLLDNYKVKTEMQLTKEQFDEVNKFLDKEIKEKTEKIEQEKLI